VTTPAAQPPRIHALAGWRRWLIWPLGLLVKAWSRTLRLEIDAMAIAALSKTDEPLLFTLWHNRLFMTAEIFRRYRRGRRLYALVSASKDGAWLTAFFETVGMRAVRGSSSRFGREALHELVAQVQAGNDIGITPDGPRGPRYDFKGGSVLLARRTGATTLLFGARFERAWRLASWDAFALPRPFSKVQIQVEVWQAEKLAEQPGPVDQLRRRLLALNPDD
jgi:hypothetical protein